MNPEIQRYIENQIRYHMHDGNYAQRVNGYDIFGPVPHGIPVYPATVATSGNTDAYTIVPFNTNVNSVDFSALVALTADNTNYVTFSITNLGQDGSGTAQILAASDTNTTKATGGTGIGANTRRQLVITQDATATEVKQGDRLRFRAAATGTLANTLTFPVYLIRFTQ